MKILIWGCGCIGGSLAKTIAANQERFEEPIFIAGYDDNPAWSRISDIPSCYDNFYTSLPTTSEIQQMDIIFICTNCCNMSVFA